MLTLPTQEPAAGPVSNARVINITGGTPELRALVTAALNREEDANALNAELRKEVSNLKAEVAGLQCELQDSKVRARVALGSEPCSLYRTPTIVNAVCTAGASRGNEEPAEAASNGRGTSPRRRCVRWLC